MRPVSEAIHVKNKRARRKYLFSKWIGFLLFNISFFTWLYGVFNGLQWIMNTAYVIVQWSWIAEVLYHNSYYKYHAGIDWGFSDDKWNYGVIMGQDEDGAMVVKDIAFGPNNDVNNDAKYGSD